jgi:site-specific recombinase XerC
MMDDDTTLPTRTGPDRLPSPLERLAEILEEEIWLQKQRSARTRRAYRLDVQHFMRTLAITTPVELHQADHKAVIAWERYMRETEHAAASTIRRRLAALSSLYKHLVRHDHATRNPVGEVERPAINRDEGSTLASSKPQARKLLDAPAENTIAGLRDRAILSVGLQVGLRRAEIAALKVGDLHQNRGFDSLRVSRKGGRRDALAINLQTAARSRLSGGLGARRRHRRAPVPAAHAQRQAPGRASAHGPRRDRPRGPEICGRARARSRLLGALGAGDIHHHGARERRAARGCAEGGRAPRSGHHQALRQAGYNPEKAASFFATY